MPTPLGAGLPFQQGVLLSGREGSLLPHLARSPHPAALGPSETQGPALLTYPEPGSLVLGTEEKPQGRKGQVWWKWGSAGQPWGHLCPNASGPRTQPAPGRQPHSRNFHLLNMALSFSPSPAIARVRSLSLSLSPPLPSLPVPLIPSVACVVLALGVAWQCQGRVGGFPHCPASVGQPSTVCLVACVHVCVRVPGRQQRAAPKGCGAFPPSFPSFFPRPFSDLPPFPVPHPSS